MTSTSYRPDSQPAGDQLSPADLTRRAAIIQNCGQTMIEAGFANATEIYESCEHRISGPEPNFLGELSAFEADQDPVKKKSLYFLGLNQSTCGWRYADPKSLLPGRTRLQELGAVAFPDHWKDLDPTYPHKIIGEAPINWHLGGLVLAESSGVLDVGCCRQATDQTERAGTFVSRQPELNDQSISLAEVSQSPCSDFVTVHEVPL